MVKRLETKTEVFAYVDPVFILNKRNRKLIAVLSREGKFHNHYRGIRISELKQGELYLYAQATLTYDSSTIEREVRGMRDSAMEFIDEVQKKGYSNV